MKKVFLSALLTALLCLPFALHAQTAIPYSENFESVTALPSGWTKVGGGQAEIYTYSSHQHLGSKSLELKGDTFNVVALPQFTSEASQLMLKFWLQAESNSSSCGNFEVGYITDLADSSTFVALETYNYADHVDFVYHRVIGSSIPSDAYLAFKAHPVSTWYYWYLDDVEVVAAPTCVFPNTLAATPAVDGATVTWQASGFGETSYQYVCVLSGTTPDWTNAVTVNTNSATVTGLIPNKGYDFYVRSYCSSADQSEPSSVSFRTLCGVVTPEEMGLIGFETSEGFVTGSGQFVANPNCWTVGNLKAQGSGWQVNSYLPTIQSYGSFDGDNYLKMTAQIQGANNRDSCYAVLPQLSYPAGITNYHVKMRIKRQSNSTATTCYSDTLVVAVLADTADIRTHQVVGYAVASSSDNYVIADVSLANCTIPNGYIMLLASAPKWSSANTKYASFGIDNLQVLRNKNCATPTDLAVSDITTYSVQASWTGSSNARVMLATEPVNTPETYTNWAVDTVVNNNPATISVQPATDYYMFVQGLCTDTSEISYQSLYFQSGCDPVASFPWSQNFDSLETDENLAIPCWTNVHTEGTGTSVATVEGAYIGENRTRKLKFPLETTLKAVVVTLPPFSIPTADTHEFRLSVYRTDDGYPQYVNDGIYVITDNATSGRDTLFIPHNISNPGSVGVENQDGWFTYSVLLPYAGVNTIQIRCFGENGGVANYIDNLIVREAPACPRISRFAIDDLQSSQATFSWAPSIAANTQIVVTTEPIDPDTLATVSASVIVYNNNTITTDSVVVTGLTPAVAYYAYARNLCGAEEGEWGNHIAFRTLCEIYTITATDTYTMGFEGLDNQVRYVPCWDFIVGTTGTDQMFVKDDNGQKFVAHSGTKLFTYGNANGPFYGPEDTTYMVLPQTSNDVKDLRLKFWFASTSDAQDDLSPMYYDTLVVGVITDIADVTTFVPVQRFHADAVATYQLADVDFSDYAGANGRIAIMRVPVRFAAVWYTQYWGSNIDDVSIELAPTCKKVKNVEAEITENSALIAWTATNASSYRVIVADSAINADSIGAGDLAHIVYNDSVTADTVLVNGLSPITKYYAYVIGNCGGGDLAPVSDVCSFTTMAAIPYLQDFNVTTVLPADMRHYTVPTHLDSVIAGVESVTPSVPAVSYMDWMVNNYLGADTTSVRMEIYGAGHFRMLATPVLNFTGSDEVKLFFDVCKRDYQSSSAAEDSENYDDLFYVLAADPDMTEFTPIATWGNDTVGNCDYSLRDDIGQWFTNVELDLSELQGTYRIVFAAGSAESNDDYDIQLDNVAIYTPATVTVSANYDSLGTVTGSCNTYVGAQVEVTATAIPGYHLYQWSNGETGDTLLIDVTSDTALVAIFVVDSINITAISANEDLGSVTGGGRYYYADTVVLSAVPALGFEFVAWSDNDSNAVRTFIATEDLNLVAFFDTAAYIVYFNVNDTDGGYLVGDPSGVYNHGTQLTVTAVANPGYHFTGWSNGDTAATITYTAVTDTILTANFYADKQDVVTVNIVGAGTVTGIGTYAEGATVTLVATPQEGWLFKGWSTTDTTSIILSDSLTGDTLQFIILGDIEITAEFIRNSAVEDVEDAAYVAYTEGRQVVVSGVADRTVAIYDAAGRLVFSVAKASEDVNFQVNAAGVYFVRVSGMKSTSVVVK